VENGINTKARLMFVVFLLISISAGAAWYFYSVSQYAFYQIDTQESVSGLIAEAPVEFHGVDVGKVKSIRLVNPRSVRIIVSIDKNAPVTSASVATWRRPGLSVFLVRGHGVSVSDAHTASASDHETARCGSAVPPNVP
jgi:phospholipid/cholesterol/gamma-HCH transport system substrate-binding protein